jgi:two-component system sensor histidine kinase DesK
MTKAPATGYPEDEVFGGRGDNGWAAAIWAGVWLVYLGPAFKQAAQSGYSDLRAALGLALLIAYILLYLWLMSQTWRGARDAGEVWPAPPTRARYAQFGALIAIAVLCTLVVGIQGGGTLVFLSPVAVAVLPGRYAMLGVLGAVVAVVIAEVAYQDTLGSIAGSAFAAFMAGLITFGVRRMRIVMYQLEIARHDSQALAAAQERVRIARDLHDLLGHSLTVISVKSQLAAKLLERGETDRAAAELREVEAVSRSAMTEVREAVSGYRARSLAAELAAAEATLDGAGIETSVKRPAEQVPADGEEALGFVVREGVTNVLRHSRAAHCTISVRHSPAAVVLELQDDGQGTGRVFSEVDPAVDGADGHGLRGLAERLAAVGGTLSAGDGLQGGFVLRAELTR